MLGAMLWLLFAIIVGVIARRLSASLKITLIFVNFVALATLAIFSEWAIAAAGSISAVVFFAIWLVFTTSVGIFAAWLTEFKSTLD